jgi:hypothetical protein
VQKNDRKSVTVRFTPERHLLVRTLAARERKTIDGFVQGLVERELAARGEDLREEAQKTIDAIDSIHAIDAMKIPAGN